MPTPPSSDAVELPVISEALEKIEKAMEELEPAVITYNAYADAKARLTGVPSIRGNTTRPTVGRPRGTTTNAAGERNPKRLDELLSLIRSQPGLPLTEYAKKMSGNMSSNYAYRLRDKAKADGQIEERPSSDNKKTLLFPRDELAAREAEIAAASSK